MNKRYYIIPIFVPHKGCPHDCIFCNQKKITGQLEEVTPEDVRNKLEAYLKTIPSEGSHVEAAFFGGSFTAIPLDYQRSLLEAAFSYYEQGRLNNIRVSTRPDCIDHEIAENLKRYGVGIVELGVQSMDEEVLRLCNRGHTPEDVVKAVRLLKEYGFTVGVQMMVGLPGDSEEKALETARRLVELKPDIARIYPALVIKNTYMEEMYLRGEYTPLTVEEAAEIARKLLVVFEGSGINVIRIGLQPTENIMSGRDVAAGPFHPSMRQLVEALVYRDMLELAVDELGGCAREVEITVNPANISEVIGNKKSNIKYLKDKFLIDKIKIIQDKCADIDTIVVNIGEKRKLMSKKHYYSICYK